MKFTPGPAIAAASGSIGGTVFSHNRGGMYTRNRSIPITSTTTFANEAKSRLATASQSWQALTAIQRAAWNSYALQVPVTDALGFPRHLTGHQVFVGINARRANAADVQLDDPPIAAALPGLLTIALTADIGVGDVEFAFTATPLGATGELYVQGAVTNSPGITNVQNLLRLFMFSAAAEVSPLNIETEVTARFGTLVEGQTLHIQASVYDNATGLVSLPLHDEAVVIST